jgi:hypothetical protein
MKKITWRFLILCIFLYIQLQRIRHFYIYHKPSSNKIKIFCIGSPKTGTSSLYTALKILDYRVVRFLDLFTFFKKGENVYIKKIINSNYEAFVDWPFGKNNFYKKIDRALPGNKFILTIRDINSLKKSWINYFKNSPMEKTMLNNISDKMKQIEKRNNEIIKYFKEDNSRILIMNIIEGDDWNKLCDFLGKPVPNKPFPYKNRGRYK